MYGCAQHVTLGSSFLSGGCTFRANIDKVGARGCDGVVVVLVWCMCAVPFLGSFPLSLLGYMCPVDALPPVLPPCNKHTHV